MYIKVPYVVSVGTNDVIVIGSERSKIGDCKGSFTPILRVFVEIGYM
jgi:hypothetical protein